MTIEGTLILKMKRLFTLIHVDYYFIKHFNITYLDLYIYTIENYLNERIYRLAALFR